VRARTMWAMCGCERESLVRSSGSTQHGDCDVKVINQDLAWSRFSFSEEGVLGSESGHQANRLVSLRTVRLFN
jgi:hypothetical protein